MRLRDCPTSTHIALDRLTAALRVKNPHWTHERVAVFHYVDNHVHGTATSVRVGSTSVIESKHWALALHREHES